MLDYNGLGPGPVYGFTKKSNLEGGIRAVLQPGQTMFWDGDTIHRGSYRRNKERLTLHNSWGSVSAEVAAATAAQARRVTSGGAAEVEPSALLAPYISSKKKNVCDARFLHWTHPGTREFLGTCSSSSAARGGGVALPAAAGFLARAWDNWMATRLVPPKVALWNASHAPEEPPGYDPTEAVDEAITAMAAVQ